MLYVMGDIWVDRAEKEAEWFHAITAIVYILESRE